MHLTIEKSNKKKKIISMCAVLPNSHPFRLSVAWRAVIDGVLEARAGFHLKQLPLGGMSGPRMLGVVHDAVIFLLEQLQGAANCKRHRFRFHRCEHIEEELPLNPSGSARSEVYTRYRNILRT